MSRTFNHVAGIGDSDSKFHRPVDDRSGDRLDVTVIFTTPEATVAALKTAADLSKQLDARITLLVVEPVPIHVPLDRPLVSIEFLKRRSCDLVCEAGIVDEEVKIQICLCRDRGHALKSLLARHSLVVIGGHMHWWRRTERKLKLFLRGLGHHVILVEATRQSWRKADPAWQADVLRALEVMEMKGRHT